MPSHFPCSPVICERSWKKTQMVKKKKKKAGFKFTPSCLPCACCNHWDICPNDETCFVLILNFQKCFRQNQISPFPVPYLIKNFSASNNLCCLRQIPLNYLNFKFLVKNLCITGAKASFLNQKIFFALVWRH